MQVLRGRADGPEADRRAIADALDRTAATGEPTVRVWRPHRQVAFGRRDANADEYEEARRIARERGFAPVERDVGGRAVAYTGSTLAFARIEPVDDFRSGLSERYRAAVEDIRRGLAAVDVDAERGEPEDAFCPGTHSLRASGPDGGGKLVGIAQRVRQDAAVVSGVAIVRDRAEIAAVLEPVYAALDLPFDPASVGSVAAAGGPADPAIVARALEDALAGDRPRTVVHVRDVRDGDVHSADANVRGDDRSRSGRDDDRSRNVRDDDRSRNGRDDDIRDV